MSRSTEDRNIKSKIFELYQKGETPQGILSEGLGLIPDTIRLHCRILEKLEDALGDKPLSLKEIEAKQGRYNGYTGWLAFLAREGYVEETGKDCYRKLKSWSSN